MSSKNGMPERVQDASSDHNTKLINLHTAVQNKPFLRLLNGWIGPAEYLLALDKINAVHEACRKDLSAEDFCRSVLRLLNIEYALTEQKLTAIPATGPLVLVANHPFGGIEGIILTEVLLQARPDVKILGNYLLKRIPALADHIIAVDPIHPQKSSRLNAKGIKTALRWIAKGGALLTFPAGEVSHLNLKSRCVMDGPWSSHIAAIITKTKAKTLPVYIHGRNSILFNLMGLFHPRIRTVLLPRELMNKRESLIELTIGSTISWRKLSDFNEMDKAVEFLRFSTYLLKHRKERISRRIPLALSKKRNPQVQKPIIAPVPRAILMREIQALDGENRLLDHKDFTVYVTHAQQSPSIMREIGRLRECSFRDVGEGTGSSLDIDTFDEDYLQLFLWQHNAQEIVGAYRLGQTDRILRHRGPAGLYSTTLFNYKPQFFDHLNNALELGRSFIRTEYQKKFGCLSILWRGIGAYVARHPHYRHLYGPVSISPDYHTISKNLMVAFLSRHSMDANKASLVRPRRPVKLLKSVKRSTSFSSLKKEAIEDISMLVSEVEKDNKGVPTLIKHYLKLNGQFLAFNVDKAFANVIDGLIWVDLLKTDPKLVERFLGPKSATVFYRQHTDERVYQAA